MCCGQLLAHAAIPGVGPHDPSVHLHLEPTPTAARLARAFLAEHATGLEPPTREAAAVCVSELVTNGVLHARTPLTFGLTLGAEQLLVTVADRGPGLPNRPARDDSRTSGRGIVLVEALATRWGVVEAPDEGKTVWFTVPRTAG